MIARCSNCGAEIYAETEGIFAICKFCNASMFIYSQSSGLRYILRPSISKDSIDLIIKDFLIKNDYTGEIKIIEKDAVLFPFYREENSPRLKPAVNDSSLNLLSEIKFDGGELLFFDENKTWAYRVIEPEVEPVQVENKRIDLIYYPLIFITYEYNKNHYRLIINSFSQEVLADVLPIKRDRSKERAYIYIFIITSLILFLEFFAFESFLISFIISIITLSILWFIFPQLMRLIEDLYVSEGKENKMS